MTPHFAPPSHEDLRQHLLGRLQTLPQWPHIQPGDAQRWVDSVIAHEAHRADWLVDRLFGFSGSEIGALSGVAAGELHPFHASDAVVRAKLLLDSVSPLGPDEARALALEPQLRALYRARLAARGGLVRDDLLSAVSAQAASGQSWRVGTPPEIIEEHGKLYLIDYQCPREAVETEYAIDGVPYYLRAQLHHYRDLAAQAGVAIDGLRLCSLDYRRWDVDERDIALDTRLGAAVAEAGERYWNEHVLAGVPAPQVLINRANSLSEVHLDRPVGTLTAPIHDLVDRRDSGKSLLVATGTEDLTDTETLRDRIAERARQFLSWGLAESEASKMREMLQQSLGELLPATAVPLEIERIDTGHVRIRIDRELDEDAILSCALRLLEDRGYEPDAAKAYLEQPNFWQPAEFSSEALIEVMEKQLNLDPRNDPRFAGACVKTPSRRLEPILEMIKEMGAGAEETAGFVKGGRVRMEMPRSPLVGPMGELRAEVAGQVRRQLQAPLQAIANDFIDRRAAAETQLAASRPAPRRKKPSGA